MNKEQAKQYYLKKAKNCYELEAKTLKEHDLETSWSFFNEAKRFEQKANDPDVLNIYIQENATPYKERGENWAKLPTIKIDDLRKSNLAIYVKYEKELQEAYTRAVKKLRQLFKIE